MTGRTALLTGLKILVSVGLLAVILTGVDLDALWARLDATVGLAALAALALLQVQAIGAALRWRLVLHVEARPLPLPAAWRNVLLGLFVNQAMPSTIGGDTVRLWHGWRLGLPAGVALRSLVVDRVFSFLGLIALCLVGLPILAATAGDPLVIRGLGTLVLGGLGCLLVLLSLRLLPTRWRRRRAVGALTSVSETVWQVLARRRIALPVAALMLLPHLIDVTVVWLYALALGTNASWGAIALVFPPAILTAAVPISIAGWGLREGALVLGFGLIGLPGDAALACSLLYGLSAVATGLIGGGIWALTDAEGLAGLRHARAEAGALRTRTDAPPPDDSTRPA